MARPPDNAGQQDDRVHHGDAKSIIGTLLKSCRQSAGLSQQQLAARVGLPQSVVSKCESGERRVDLAELVTFCNATGVPVVDFVQRFLVKLGPTR